MTNKKITVIAPARLHMGFIDLSGSLGRDFGSIGVALNEIATQLTISYADKLSIQGVSSQRAEKCCRLLCELLKVSNQLAINIETAIPEHVGLGSGTQMALAIGSGLNAFYDLGLTVREIAQLTERGMRSGIGIGVFEQGGLVIDGGRGQKSLTPPLISRLPMPSQWRFILVFDRRGQGLHGEQELNAFKQLPPFPVQQAAQLCYLLLMQALPAVIEQQINLFGDVISQLQQAVGEHFSPIQGGHFTSAEVAEVMGWLEQQGAVAIGQTSWGPTGFCLVDNELFANQLVSMMQEIYRHLRHLRFEVVSVRNQGGVCYF